MENKLVCGDCGEELESGFIAEEIGSALAHGPVGASYWVEGKPEISFWTGLKLNGKRRYYIQAYRCKRCGLLKFYANR